MPKMPLWYDKMNIGMQLRPQNQGTKGHQHTVGRRIWSPILICPFLNPQTFWPSNLIRRISVISIRWYKYSVVSWKQTLSQAHRWNVIEAHIEGLMADVFLKYNPEWGRRRTVQIVRRAQGGGPGSHTYIQMPLRGQNSTTGQRFVTDYGLLPHPPLTFIKHILPPLSFFFFFFFIPPPQKSTTIW